MSAQRKHVTPAEIVKAAGRCCNLALEQFLGRLPIDELQGLCRKFNCPVQDVAAKVAMQIGLRREK